MERRRRRPGVGSLFDKGEPAKYIDIPLSNYSTWPYDRVLHEGEAVGVSTFSGYSYNERSYLSLAMVDVDVEIGTEVTLVWGEEGGGSSKPVVERHRQVEIRAIVSPCPYSEVARSSYHEGWRTKRPGCPEGQSECRRSRVAPGRCSRSWRFWSATSRFRRAMRACSRAIASARHLLGARSPRRARRAGAGRRGRSPRIGERRMHHQQGARRREGKREDVLERASSCGLLARSRNRGESPR